MEFLGFRRGDESFGVRNYLAVVPTVGCVADLAVEAARQLSMAAALPHHQGCCQPPVDLRRCMRVLTNLCLNPNVAAVLVVGMGCEGVSTEGLASAVRGSKPVEAVDVQSCGGYLEALRECINAGHNLLLEVKDWSREPVDISKLTVAVKCGASDATSGIASNPAVGAAVDTLVDEGATVVFGETTEIIGAEHLLAKRAASREVAEELLKFVHRLEEKAKAVGVDIRGGQPTPGNIRGGITTLEEKSLGAIAKAGSRPLAGVLEYGERPVKPGLYFMDTPGREPEAMTGFAACGAQVIVFTTGRGAVQGFPVVPVVKVCGNPETCKKLRSHIDVDVSGIIEGVEGIEEAGRRVLKEVLAVASGKPCRAELAGCQGAVEIYVEGPIL